MDEKTVNINKRKIYITLLIVVICLIGVSYAFFTLYLRQSQENTITSLTCLSTFFEEESPGITLTNAYAVSDEEGMTNEPFTFYLENECNETTYVYITIDSLNEGASTNLDSSHVKYNLSTYDTTDGFNAIVKSSSIKRLENGHDGYIIKTLALGSGESIAYDLRLWVDEATSSADGLGKTWSGQVVIVSDAEEPNIDWNYTGQGTLLAAIKRDNTVTTPTTIPGTESSADTEALLASTADDYGTSYYFRGAVENNYVEYANMCWRIVRVTGNGSIKLVLYNYNGLTSTNNTPSSSTPCNVTGDDLAFARYEGDTYKSKFNSIFTDNAYVGFMYGNVGCSDGVSISQSDCTKAGGTWTASTSYANAHANTNASTILTNLNKWYTNVLSKQANFKDSQLADTIWCNDKSVVTDTTFNPNGSTLGTNYGYEKNGNYYGATKRLIQASSNKAGGTGPSLMCPNDHTGGKLSKFTVSDTEYGNGALSGYAKVGLLTADEIAFAGGAYNTSNSTYYIKGNTNTNSCDWWSLSPYYFNGRIAVGWIVSGGDSDLRRVNVIGNRGVRPSLSLASNIKISSGTGTGTATNPYKVVME